MTSRVRKAEPEDSEFVTQAIIGAARSHLAHGAFDQLFPDPDDRADVVEWMVLSDVRSPCHYSGFRLLELDGTAVAAATGFAADKPSASGLGGALADAFDGLDLPEDSLAQAFENFAVYEKCAPPLAPGGLVLEYVYTAEAHRRRGFACALLTHLIDEARNAGSFSSAQISFFIGNEPARLAYESLGFKVDDHRVDSDFEQMFGTPGMARMMLSLCV